MLKFRDKQLHNQKYLKTRFFMCINQSVNINQVGTWHESNIHYQTENYNYRETLQSHNNNT